MDRVCQSCSARVHSSDPHSICFACNTQCNLGSLDCDHLRAIPPSQLKDFQSAYAAFLAQRTRETAKDIAHFVGDVRVSEHSTRPSVSLGASTKSGSGPSSSLGAFPSGVRLATSGSPSKDSHAVYSAARSSSLTSTAVCSGGPILSGPRGPSWGSDSFSGPPNPWMYNPFMFPFQSFFGQAPSGGLPSVHAVEQGFPHAMGQSRWAAPPYHGGNVNWQLPSGGLPSVHAVEQGLPHAMGQSHWAAPSNHDGASCRHAPGGGLSTAHHVDQGIPHARDQSHQSVPSTLHGATGTNSHVTSHPCASGTMFTPASHVQTFDDRPGASVSGSVDPSETGSDHESEMEVESPSHMINGRTFGVRSSATAEQCRSFVAETLDFAHGDDDSGGFLGLHPLWQENCLGAKPAAASLSSLFVKGKAAFRSGKPKWAPWMQSPTKDLKPGCPGFDPEIADMLKSKPSIIKVPLPAAENLLEVSRNTALISNELQHTLDATNTLCSKFSESMSEEAQELCGNLGSLLRHVDRLQWAMQGCNAYVLRQMMQLFRSNIIDSSSTQLNAAQRKELLDLSPLEQNLFGGKLTAILDQVWNRELHESVSDSLSRKRPVAAAASGAPPPKRKPATQSSTSLGSVAPRGGGRGGRGGRGRGRGRGFLKSTSKRGSKQPQV